MKYIVHRRFKQQALCGEVNIPALTECEEVNGMICLDHKPLCIKFSENAHQFFARNDDGNGLERGQLTHGITSLLTRWSYPHDGAPTESVGQKIKEHNEQADKAWERVRNDATCQMYRRIEHRDHWIWNHAFFNADIETLRYIAALVGVRR